MRKSLGMAFSMLLISWPVLAQGTGLEKRFQDLEDPDESVREQAVESLLRTEMDPGRDLPVVLRALSSSNADVRFYAAGFLSKVAYTDKASAVVLQGAAGPLAEHLADPDPRVREGLAFTFALLQPSVPLTSVPALLGRLGDQVWKVNVFALDALARVRPVKPPVVDAVVEELKQDQNSAVRGAAARALGTMGDTRSEVIDALTSALRDPDPFVRQETVRSLGQIGPPAAPALESLARLAKDPASSRVLQQNVRAAIRRIKGKS